MQLHYYDNLKRMRGSGRINLGSYIKGRSYGETANNDPFFALHYIPPYAPKECAKNRTIMHPFSVNFSSLANRRYQCKLLFNRQQTPYHATPYQCELVCTRQQTLSV